MASVLIIILASALASTTLATTQNLLVARLASFNYPWELDGIPFMDDGYTKLVQSMAPLAVKLFNSRRDDILPILGTLGSCNKQLDIPYSCATGGNSRMAFAQAFEVASSPDKFPHI